MSGPLDPEKSPVKENGDPEKSFGSRRSQRTRDPTSRPASRVDEHQDGEASPDYEIVSFEKNSPEHPNNWTTWKKTLVLMIVINTCMNSNLGSTLATGLDSMTKGFGATNKALLVTPSSMYLMGYVLGPTIAAPMSEFYGRRMVLLSSFTFFWLSTLGAAVSPNIGVLILFRFLMGLGGGTPLSVVGGTCADLYADDIRRGRALGLFVSAAGFGPAFGTTLSGYLSPRSWKLPYWAELAIAGASLILLLFCPETFVPALLKKKAKRMRKAGDAKARAPTEVEGKTMKQFLQQVVLTPIKMFCTEPLVFFSCLYLALVYAVFYMFFQAYHRVYEDGYKMTPGEAGLTFFSIAIGGMLGWVLSLGFDAYLRKGDAKGTFEGPRRDEYRRLPLACIAGPMFVLCLFITGKTASEPEKFHWAIPVSSLLLFGAGYSLIFMALTNYLVDSYEIYAASSMAASSATRSLLGAAFPYANTAFYGKLGIKWGMFLLAFVMLAITTIPFVFLYYGPKIREHSKWFQELKQHEREQSGTNES